MQNKSYISTLEQRLLVGFVLFFSLLFYLNFAEFKIEKYNDAVKSEQVETAIKASNIPDERISFSMCTWGKPIITEFYWLNLFLLPLNFFLLKRKRFVSFILSTITILSVLTISFYWARYNYSPNLTTNLIWLSTFIAFSSLLILQLAIITRFVFEKNHAKISLR